MNCNYLLIPLTFLSLNAFCQQQISTSNMHYLPNPAPKNTIVKSLSNEDDNLNALKASERSVDYPTQIIRMSSPIPKQMVNCDQVNDEIEKVLLNNIVSKQFTYTMYISCSYDPETNYATKFTINSYFDPLNDEAIDFLKTYLEQYNGSDLLGAKLTIESAKGLIIALNISAGMKKNPNNPPFIEYREDRSNFYFKSNYEMRNQLLTDMNQNFFSNDPEKVLPFLNRWLFAYAGIVYKGVLRDSNYAELQPERIFLMEDGEKIFVADLKYYFAHHCNKYPNHRCLRQEL